MKKLLLAAALASATVATHAGVWDSVATSDWPSKPTKKYKLEMYGFDARAYEFVTENGMRCVAVFPGGSTSGWQLSCLPVAAKAPNSK